MIEPDLYTTAHKALRLAVSHTASLLGGADASTVVEVAEPVAQVLDELDRHAAHEDEFIAPLLDRHLPDLGIEIARQHLALGASIDAVHRQLDGLVRGPDVAPGAPLALYRAHQRMAAQNLLHLDHEETVVMPALWSTVSTATLVELLAAFGAAHPEAAQLFHRWPTSLTPAERARFGIDVVLATA